VIHRFEDLDDLLQSVTSGTDGLILETDVIDGFLVLRQYSVSDDGMPLVVVHVACDTNDTYQAISKALLAEYKESYLKEVKYTEPEAEVVFDIVFRVTECMTDVGI